MSGAALGESDKAISVSLTDADFLAIASQAGDYYSATLVRHGATPPGVDWESDQLQQLRFAELLKVADMTRSFSLNDLGCGYGALLAHLKACLQPMQFDYLGIDIAEEMVREARRLWGAGARARFVVGSECPRQADYSVASGIFNVRLDQPTELWERYVTRILGGLHEASRLGFAVNFRAESHSGLSSAGLYETRPERWVYFCEEGFDASVEVVADYGLREFTLLVRPKASPWPERMG